MSLTDNKGLDGNHGGQNDKGGINDGPGWPCIHNDSMIWAPNSSNRNISDERMVWQRDSLQCNFVNLPFCGHDGAFILLKHAWRII